MAEEVFEQVVNQQGTLKQGISGGLKVILEKLLELEQKIDEINGKLSEAKTG